MHSTNKCCYNRPFDDLTYDPYQIETEAVLTIIRTAEAGTWSIVGSDILDVEMNKNPDSEKKEKVKMLYHIITETISHSIEIKNFADEIRSKSNIAL